MAGAGEEHLWWEGALALVAEPGGGTVGPAAMRQGAWLQTCDELVEGDPSPVVALAARQGFVVTRGQALRLGMASADLRRRVATGSWTKPRYGVMCPLAVRTDARPHGASPEIAIAAAVLSRPGAIASHESVAILNGLPVLTPPPRPVLTVARASAGGGWRDCLIRACPTPRSERAEWFGCPTTTVARAVVDIARSGGVAAGLVTADAALREGLATRADLAVSLRRARRRPGVTAAVRVVELADGRAESPLESLTRLCMVDAALPPFEPQGTVATDRGTVRVDFLFRAQRVVVEADGLLKYRRDGDALVLEKLRQEAIERAGYRVVRVTWDDIVYRPQETIARILRALGPTLATR
jgi:hypothetical protein